MTGQGRTRRGATDHDEQRFRLGWIEHDNFFGPHPEATLEEAIQHRDEMIARKCRDTPDDIHERRGHVITFTVYIEALEDGHWVRVQGSERSCISGASYPEDER